MSSSHCLTPTFNSTKIIFFCCCHKYSIVGWNFCSLLAIQFSLGHLAWLAHNTLWLLHTNKRSFEQTTLSASWVDYWVGLPLPGLQIIAHNKILCFCDFCNQLSLKRHKMSFCIYCYSFKNKSLKQKQGACSTLRLIKYNKLFKFVWHQNIALRDKRESPSLIVLLFCL